MNAGKTVFAQILEHVPRYEFDKFVKQYEGNHEVRMFPCYDQFLRLAYAQLAYRESLRDIKILPELLISRQNYNDGKHICIK
jgi:hypothetical protein